MLGSFVQTPHLAIIHLLRSQGCCSDQQRPVSNVPSLLSEQKFILEKDLITLKHKTSNYPCAIRLEDEVIQFQQLIGNLKHQNNLRRQEGWVEIQKIQSMLSTQSTAFLQEQSNKMSEHYAHQRSQQRRLQQEYQLLMMRVRKLHEWNEGIVNSYGKREYSSTI